jgi:DNA repair exonuclease SbcCD ATPase subunit
LIARQRENLKATFTLSEQPNPQDRAIDRVARIEGELADLTTEFTLGLEAVAGPVPCLHDALDAMRSATEGLSKWEPGPARGFEETALANLIKARKNIRQFLAQSSSCASATRKFDQKQRQKLRPKKNDKAAQAKLQQDLEKLAQEEKKIAQEIAAKNDGAKVNQAGRESAKKSSSDSTKNSGSASSSGQSLGQRQEKAAAKAEELKQLVHKNEKLTDLARERMDGAAQEAQSSAVSFQQGREGDAGKHAASAAEHLERLAKQVAALTASELTTRLAHGQNMARHLAREQEGLEKELRDRKGSGESAKERAPKAAKERGLSEEARTLADLLQKLQPEAEAANPQLGRDLRQAIDANSPAAAGDQMRRAADLMQAGQLEQAVRDVNGSGHMMQELAQQLDAARRAAIQPQLDKLLAAEKQAAETKKTLDAVNNDRQKAQAEKKVADLRDTLESLKNADGKLAEATEALDGAVRGGAGGWERREPHDPHYGVYVRREYGDGVRQVMQALQAKIQDIILRDILVDRDEPVPPQYRALVEEYYRVLSDDVR